MAEDTMVGRYLDARAKAVLNGDAGIVREVDWQLNRLGYRPAAPAAAEARAESEARPTGRPTGRRAERGE